MRCTYAAVAAKISCLDARVHVARAPANASVKSNMMVTLVMPVVESEVPSRTKTGTMRINVAARVMSNRTATLMRWLS
jgi:hypothetical protein